MTYRQLEQYLRTEKWRAGAEYGADMCGRYARCAFCDRSAAYPCAYAFDALVREVGLGSGAIPEWVTPEPPVEERFGTVYAEPDTGAAPEADEAYGGAVGEYQGAVQEFAQDAAYGQSAETEAAEAPEEAPQEAPQPPKVRTLPAPKKIPRPRGVIKIEKISGDACVLKLKRKQK